MAVVEVVVFVVAVVVVVVLVVVVVVVAAVPEVLVVVIVFAGDLAGVSSRRVVASCRRGDGGICRHPITKLHSMLCRT